MADILGIGASGLTAYRKLLETVGSNITNANTDGYVRRDVSLVGVGESTMLPTAKPNTSGSGVIIEAVRRASDYFLQSQALNSNSLQQQSQIVADSMKQLEKTLFASGNDPGSVVQSFFNTFSDAANSPTSVPARLAVIDAGQRVTRMFNQAANAIDYSIKSLRSGLEVGLATVNDLAKQLARTNEDIQRSTSSGQKPNDLLDQRDKILAKMSDLIGFTFIEAKNGTIEVYLGESTSGKPLVGSDGAHLLGVDDSNGRIDIVFDPYTAPMVTSQVKSGTIAGLLNFHDEADRLMMDINRLAVGLSTAVNEVHQRGVDLNGDAGRPLFSTDGLLAQASAANRGSSNLTLAINEAASLTGADYTASYDDSKKQWTVKSTQGSSVSGANNLTLDGITFTFKGSPAQGDIFAANPLFSAAQSMRFLRQTAPELAFAIPYYVDPSSTNTGQATLSVQKNSVSDPSPTITNAIALFGQNNTPAKFKSLGSAFYLPAGMSNATVDSLGTLSAVHFTSNDIVVNASSQNKGKSNLTITGMNPAAAEKRYSARYDSISQKWTVRSSSGSNITGSNDIIIDGLTFRFDGAALDGDAFTASIPVSTLASQLLSLDNQKNDGTAVGLSLSFALNGNTQAPITLSITQTGNTLSSLAKDINNALVSAGYSDALLATTKGDTFSIVALGDNMISDGRFSGFNTDGISTNVSGTTEARDLPSEVRIFTREGRQISGPLFASEADASAFLTVANGFLSTAVYVPPSDTQGYPGIELAQSESLLTPVKITPDSVKITVEAYPHLDATQGDASSMSAGAVYALNVGTLPPIRLTGDVIAGKNANDLAVTIADALNFKASVNSWQGAPLSLDGTSVSKLDFTVNIAQTDPITGEISATKSYPITFQRSKDADGNWLNNGTFDLKGAEDISANVVIDNGVPYVVISAKPTLSTKTPVLSLSSSSSLAALGLSASSLKKQITASGDITSTYPVTLKLMTEDGPQSITIDGPQSSSPQFGVTWSLKDGRLSLSSTYNRLALVCDDPDPQVSAALRDAADSLGLFGSDLDVSVDDNSLVIRSSIDGVAAAEDFIDVSGTVSRVGFHLGFKNVLREDLIVALTKNNSAQRLIVDMPRDPLPPQISAIFPDVKVRILSQNELEILDVNGVSLATREWNQGEPVTYLGMSFMISGTANSGDVFTIENDTSRSGDNRNALSLYKLTTQSIFGRGQGSFQDVYSSIAAKVGATANSADVTAKAAQKSASDLKAAYDSKTGVDLDREAADLLRFQQAYQASAQVVSAARELFATLLRIF